MVARQYSMTKNGRMNRLPISAVIQTANLFCCDIYIKAKAEKINVKSYNELQKGIQPKGEKLVVYFDGSDEEEADVKFRYLFGG